LRSSDPVANRHVNILPSQETRARVQFPQNGCDTLEINPTLPAPSAYSKLRAVSFARCVSRG